MPKATAALSTSRLRFKPFLPMATIAAGLRNHRAADSTDLGEDFAAGVGSKNAGDLILMVERIGKEDPAAGKKMVGAILDAKSLTARLRLVDEALTRLRAVVARH